MDISWMPVQGRHPVEIGVSLSRALKARRGAGNPPKRSNIPDRNFHCCRYNFKPESVDPARTSTIEVKKGKDSSSVVVERASTVAGESHLFEGPEVPAREFDCILIYDEELGRFTLEKLDSVVTLSYSRRVTASVASPAATTPSQASTSKEPAQTMSLDEELERELLGTADAEGDVDPDDDLEKALSAAVEASASKPAKKPLPKILKKEEEEEEEEEGEIPLSALLKDTPRKPPQTTPKPPPPAPTLSHAPPKPKPKPKPSVVKGKSKREHPLEPGPLREEDVEEEVLEFGRPTRPAKRSKLSPPVSLALPTPTKPQPAAISLALPSPSNAANLPPPPPPQAVKSAPVYSDSEEEWDEVPATSVQPPEPVQVDTADDDGDIDLFNDEFESALGATKDDEIDFLAAELEGAVESSNTAKAPMSLNQFASGGTVDYDDYSSTDESDED